MLSSFCVGVFAFCWIPHLWSRIFLRFYAFVGWFEFPSAGLQDLKIEPPAKTDTCQFTKKMKAFCMMKFNLKLLEHYRNQGYKDCNILAKQESWTRRETERC